MGDYARTLGQAIDETLKTCNDFVQAGRDGHIWTRAEVKLALQRIYLDFVRDAGTLMGSDTVALVDGQNVYDLPADCIYPTRLAVPETSVYMVTPKSLIHEVDLVGHTQADGGSSNQIYQETLAYNQFGVWPLPGLGMDGVLVDITYVRAPASWDDELEIPDTSVPEWMQKDLRYGAAAFLMRSLTDPNRIGKGAVLAGYWDMKVATFKRTNAIPNEHEGMVPF